MKTEIIFICLAVSWLSGCLGYRVCRQKEKTAQQLLVGTYNFGFKKPKIPNSNSKKYCKNMFAQKSWISLKISSLKSQIQVAQTNKMK